MGSRIHKLTYAAEEHDTHYSLSQRQSLPFVRLRFWLASYEDGRQGHAVEHPHLLLQADLHGLTDIDGLRSASNARALG